MRGGEGKAEERQAGAGEEGGGRDAKAFVAQSPLAQPQPAARGPATWRGRAARLGAHPLPRACIPSGSPCSRPSQSSYPTPTIPSQSSHWPAPQIRTQGLGRGRKQSGQAGRLGGRTA